MRQYSLIITLKLLLAVRMIQIGVIIVVAKMDGADPATLSVLENGVLVRNLGHIVIARYIMMDATYNPKDK